MRAVRRSRAAQAAQKRRRQRSAVFLSLLAVALAVGSLWTIGAATGNDMVEAAVTRAQSLADLIGQRSPGARTEAQLTKWRHERALAKVREAPKRHAQAVPAPTPGQAEFAQLLQAPVPMPGAVDLQHPLALADLGSPPPFPAAVLFPGSEPQPGPPGSSSPAPFLPGTQPPPPIMPPPAVPEPQTWAMMLLGFGLIGWQVRRRVPRTLAA